MEQDAKWYTVGNADEVPSPSLLVYPDRINTNIRRMIAIAGDASRLRPHVKTHKTPEIVRMQMDLGVFRFKCATISEMEMVAGCGARDIVLAYQPVGPNLEKFFSLKRTFPDTIISCVLDSEEVAVQLSLMASQRGLEAGVWIDMNNGMNRTGISPGEGAEKLALKITELPFLTLNGLHIYDGHIRQEDFTDRKKICDDSFRPVAGLLEKIRNLSGNQLKVIAGGTSTFPIHAARKDVECSPGTTTLWDYGYSSSFPDLDFLHAAVLFTRIISKPANGMISLDLGHKAVASEMPHPRVIFPDIGEYRLLIHSEEHMVIETPEADRLRLGDTLYGIPWHICPTVDRFDTVFVADKQRVVGHWDVTARKRKITI
jgi:D-threonine aldolase